MFESESNLGKESSFIKSFSKISISSFRLEFLLGRFNIEK